MKQIDKMNISIGLTEYFIQRQTSREREGEKVVQWFVDEWHLKCRVIVSVRGVQRLEEFFLLLLFFS